MTITCLLLPVCRVMPVALVYLDLLATRALLVYQARQDRRVIRLLEATTPRVPKYV